MAEIDVFGVIDKGFSDGLRKQIKAIPTHEPIELFISSPGGYLCEGITAYNLLRSAPNEVLATMVGDAFSAATLLVCAADHCDMPDNTLFMIHEPYVPVLSPATLETIQTTSNYLKATKAQTSQIYADKTKKDKRHWSKLMREETYMSADEALGAGFISNVTVSSPNVKNEATEKYSCRNKKKLAAMLGDRRVVRDLQEILDSIGVNA